MSQGFQLLSAICRDLWAIEPETAYSYGPFIAGLIAGKEPRLDMFAREHLKKADDYQPIAAEEDNPSEEFDWYLKVMEPGANAPRYLDRYSQARPGSVAIIPIKGTLLKNDTISGMPGADSKRMMINSAFNTETIVSVVLENDSPGGQVTGTELLGKKIAEAKKPVVNFTDGINGSASYFLTSASHYMMASGKSSEIGSIGVLLSFADMTQYWEDQGIKLHDVVADGSPDKIKAVQEALKDNYKELKEQRLNPAYQAFRDFITNQRTIKAEAMTGKIYDAEKAIEMGLIDAIGTFEDAIEKARELAEEAGTTSGESTQGNSQTSNNDDSMLFGNKFPKTNAALKAGIDGNEIDESQLQEANEELSNNGVNLSLITAQEGKKLENRLPDLEQKESTLDAITALFGEEAKAEGFDTKAAVEQLMTDKQNAETAKATAETEQQQAETAKQNAEKAKADLEAERDALQEKVNQYGSQPGQMHTNPQKTGSDPEPKGEGEGEELVKDHVDPEDENYTANGIDPKSYFNESPKSE